MRLGITELFVMFGIALFLLAGGLRLGDRWRVKTDETTFNKPFFKSLGLVVGLFLLVWTVSTFV